MKETRKAKAKAKARPAAEPKARTSAKAAKAKTMVGPGFAPTGTAAILRAFALAYPGAHEEFPWGERVVKVKGRVFVFLGRDEGVGLSVKLPQSLLLALGLPFASPTAYGLGKSGWVTAQFAPQEKPPIDVLKAWIDESYRAVAPKKLLAELAKGKGPKGRLA
jgi:predicted DNA-binding protein (MmcQ/YjbR family)